MIKKSLLLIFWVAVVIVLLLFSLVFKDTNTAIVAQVEPMKNAISYHKAVRIKEIYVIPGQTVNPGDTLVMVEKPDLILEEEKKLNEIERLKVERALVESKYAGSRQQLIIKKNTELRRIEGEIEQLQVVISNNKKLSKQFGNLTGFTDTVQNNGSSYYEIELGVLEREKEYVLKEFELEMSAAMNIYEEDIKTFDILELQNQKELDVILAEIGQQIRTSDIHGTIGSVNAQPGELISPFTTILSIYEANPSVIKAIMNEGYEYEIEVGSTVNIESTNRRYNIDGKIIEIGARIIEYPNRLKSNQNIPMWGQEIFIKIPEENKFLNGERVLVNIKR